MSYHLLIINPGSTSTKIGVYEDETPVFIETLKHSALELSKFTSIYEQLEFRMGLVLTALSKRSLDIRTLQAVVGRGGLVKPIESGTYAVNENMLHDLKTGLQGHHASNLGGIIAYEIAKPLNIPAFIVDPVTVDEVLEVAKITGLPQIKRKCIWHALNQKAIAKRYAKDTGKNYNEINLIVAHMGGGISVGAHMNGRVIDVNNALDGEGPFSPERSGELPIRDVINMCYSGNYTMDEMMKKLNGQGGYVVHLGTNDARQVEELAAAGDEKAGLVRNALAYQVSKEIGKCAAVLSGKADAILLTGGIAYDKDVVNYINEKVKFIAPVVNYPGEDELLALAQGALRVLTGDEKAKEY